MNERLNFATARQEYLTLSRAYLGRGREYEMGTRAYPVPERLVEAMSNETYRLQATLQYQGGLRCEGVGAPSGKLGNPLTWDNLKGLVNDSVTGKLVGRIEVREKAVSGRTIIYREKPTRVWFAIWKNTGACKAVTANTGMRFSRRQRLAANTQKGVAHMA